MLAAMASGFAVIISEDRCHVVVNVSIIEVILADKHVIVGAIISGFSTYS